MFISITVNHSKKIDNVTLNYTYEIFLKYFEHLDAT